VHQLTLALGVSDRADAADQSDADSGERRHLHHGRRTTSGRSTRARRSQLWRYTYPTNQGFHIGHRGAAVYKDSVYLTTPDAHLVGVELRSHGQGEVGRRVADAKRGYWSTNAPLVIRNHVLVGVSGDFDNLPGILQSFDPEYGRASVDVLQHAAGRTPNSQSAWRHRGQMWMTGTYDPDLNLVFVGTGNPTPVFERTDAPGRQQVDRQHRRARSDTGKLAWGFQASPHDTHDWDAAKCR